MTTYVLVGGAWLGGWAWQPVTRQLRERGHDVHPVTLTGLGDRSHLATPETDLDTYLDDVVNLVEFEDLHDVVLVGHSYAGHVVTGVGRPDPERIAQLVYLDAGPSPDGAASSTSSRPGQGADRAAGRPGRRRLADPHAGVGGPGGGHGRQPGGLGPDERARMRARAVAQPVRTWTQPLTLRDPARDQLPKVLISCSIPLAQVQEMIAAGHPWFAELAGSQWSLLELPTGHWPMFSVPGPGSRLSASVSHILDLRGGPPTVAKGLWGFVGFERMSHIERMFGREGRIALRRTTEGARR